MWRALQFSLWYIISASALLRSGLFPRSSRTTSLQAALSLSERVGEAVRLKYGSGGGGDVSRVLKCWSDFTAGKKLHRYVDAPANEVLQTADCFVEGLTATPFHDVSNFAWTKGLEDNYKLIRDELVAYEYKRRSMPVSAEVGLQLAPTGSGQQGDGEWLGPRDTSGTHYGPEWKTLGIQDRSAWDAELTREFPRTIELMISLKVPSCEVFFAKQGPRSGLKPHSDKNNFIMTCHLALDVPEGQCWIQCGVDKHHWLNGKTCIFDTSIIHSTENSSDRTRYVLLIRFWHPELTAAEVDAFKFIFAYLDHAGLGEEALERFEMQQLFMGKDQHKGLQKSMAATGAGAGRAKGQGKGGGGGGGMKNEMAAARADKPRPKGFGSK
jgi:aspartate beta-hydroxylase